MNWFLLISGLILLLGLTGCNTTGGQTLNFSSANVSGCVIAGIGTYSGQCQASVP